jgi:hypothetical protein
MNEYFITSTISVEARSERGAYKKLLEDREVQADLIRNAEIDENYEDKKEPYQRY